MKVLITGANGFVGKNLVARLRSRKNLILYLYDIHDSVNDLERYCKDCEFVFHLAGVNRPVKAQEYWDGNFSSMIELLELLKKHGNHCPIMCASSTQATHDSPYGKSKRAGEEAVFDYAKLIGVNVYVYRFPNLFGKWCRPNYNSVIATFCYKITRNEPIEIRDYNQRITFAYIDDVITELEAALENKANRNADGFCEVPTTYTYTLGEIVDLLYLFQKSREDLFVPNETYGSFESKLYATYLSYLKEDDFSYPLKVRKDERGSFTEWLKGKESGQISVNITKPGITKGNHWHHTKHEKFLVVSGEGLILLRNIHSNTIVSYPVNGENLIVVDIPVGYTHSITNVGHTELITMIWCSECYDKQHPDTYSMPVKTDVSMGDMLQGENNHG